MRPLDFLGRIKVKLGIVIVGAVVTAFIVNEVGIAGGVPRDLRIAFAVFLALIMVQVLGRGMTKPLREMAAAAQTIAKGSYGLRVTATSRDEVGELARAFNAMAADLGEVDRQRRDLIANVSHELRTPITGVQAVLENVVDGVSPPEPEILGTALAQTQRLGRLVAQLLDLSRLDSGARPIEIEEFDLGDLGGQAVREASMARHDVTVASTIEPGRHLTTADPVLLAQVLANLLDNAVRHSPPGGTVTLTSRASADGTLEIEVADEGPGIPADDRQRVFERFSRLDAGRAADAGGAGLGLAIAKEIAELHGGTVAVVGGTGCHMLLTLPKAVRELSPASAARTHAAGRTPAGAVRARLRKESASRETPAVSRSGTDTEAGPMKGSETQPSGPAGVPAEATSPAGSYSQTAQTPEAAEGVGSPSVPGAEAVPVSPMASAGGPGSSVEDSTGATPVSPTEPSRTEGSSSAPGPGSLSPRSGQAVPSDSRVAASVGMPGPDTRPVAQPSGAAPDSSAVAGSAPGNPGEPTAPAIPLPAEFAPAGSVRTAVTSPHPVMASSDPAGRPSVTGAPTVPVHVGGNATASGGPPRSSQRTYLLDEPPPHRSLGGAILGGVVGAIVGVLGGTIAAGFFVGGSATEVQAAGALLLFMCIGIAVGASLGGRVKATPDQPGGRFDTYTPPPLFPRPNLPDTPRWVLPAATATGLVAAVCFPYAPTGIGVVLTAVALSLAVVPAIRHRINAWSIAYGLAAYGLVFVAFFRDADWLVGLSLLAAFVVASLALSGGRGWAGVARGLLSVGLAVFPVPWFVIGPVRTVLKRRNYIPVLISLGITAILIALFGVLFISADAVFSSFARDLLSAPAWAETVPVRIFLFVVFAVLAVAAVLVALRPVAEPRVDYAPLNLAKTLWVIPLVGVNLLFAAFVGVQVSVLFGGSRRVLETAGLTFAEYARSGFFELITVSVFVLFIVAFCSMMIKGDRWIMATLLGLLCALTLVILASALHRLGLYTAAYGFTRLRASVGATIWWIAAVFVLVLIGGLVKRTSWLPKALVLLTAVSLLVFAVWNPDAQVAETQVSVRGVDRLDEHYLARLSADAIPGLDRLPEPIRSCVLMDVIETQDLHFPEPWNGWNLSRQKAARILAAHPVNRAVTCEDKYRSAY
ncbi:DUF4153 domain-containing protein [Herbidospora mongoliensis]|uniref:DUF4153 domain-containing protein n=1 Tax=Herbidospora mongoliensis TaxID=688067 RepID=UPI00082F443D|nr:DUF4153 domain-containing protein [Herbidospora mongoliensis]